MVRLCSLASCSRPYYAKGYCNTHWRRARKYGDPGENWPIAKYSYTPEQALAEKVVPGDGGCLLWTGWLNNKGYGFISVGGGDDAEVHRYVWEKENGPIPSGMVIDHRCHNRNCVNIDHLRLATARENMFHRQGATSRSKTGVRNVTKKGNRFLVYINKDYTTHYIGSFKTLSEAKGAASKAREELFGKEWAGKG